MSALQTKINSLETAQLKEIAQTMNNDFSDEAMIVVNEVETILLDRLSESEFVEFMNQLEKELEEA